MNKRYSLSRGKKTFNIFHSKFDLEKYQVYSQVSLDDVYSLVIHHHIHHETRNISITIALLIDLFVSVGIFVSVQCWNVSREIID